MHFLYLFIYFEGIKIQTPKISNKFTGVEHRSQK